MPRSSFAAVWTSSASGDLGNGLFKTALPLLALRLTDSPTLVAGVVFALTVPWALFALPAGALVDRLDRRRVMLTVSLVRCAALVALAVIAIAQVGGIAAVYAVAFALGTCETLADTAAGALVPAIVGRDRLEWANTRLVGSQTVLHEFVGPPLGGALVAVSVAAALGASAITYLVAAGALLFLHGSFRPAPAAGRRGFGGEVVEGLRFLWRNPALRSLSLMTAVTAGAWSAWEAVLVLYVVHGPVGLGPVGYGLLLSNLAVGGIAGALAARPLQRAIGTRGVIAVDIVATIVMLATPALSANAYVIGAATLIGGLGSGMWNVVVVSLRQRLTPDALMGRVMASGRLLGWGTLPLGAALGGVIADVAGVRAVFAIGAVLSAAVALPLLRHLDAGALAGDRPAAPAHAAASA